MTYEQSRSGGASGIGKHLAKTLHSQGVTLIIADINEVTGVSLVEALNKSRGQYVREKNPLIEIALWNNCNEPFTHF